MSAVGIIGFGRWGKNHLRTCNELGIPVTWVASKSKSTLDSEMLKDIHTTTDYQDILNDSGVDAVIIATPPKVSEDIAIEALRAGKHVLVEKPPALSVKKIDDACALAKKHNLVYFVGHIHLYNPPIIRLEEDIEKGLFGKIITVQTTGTGHGPIREDFGAHWDYFPHDLSVLFFLLKGNPEIVSVSGSAYKDHHDTVSLHLRFPGGTNTYSYTSWHHPVKSRRIIVSGEKGFAIFDDYSERKLTYLDKELNETFPEYSEEQSLKEEVRAFMHCIESEEEPRTSGESAKPVVAILEEIDKKLR